MSFAIKFSSGALSDLRETNKWYEEKAVGLGKRFSDAIDSQTEKLCIRPSIYRKFHGDVHRCSVSGFPYAIYYKIEGTSVIVVAVHGSRQDPESLLKKIVRKEPKPQI